MKKEYKIGLAILVLVGFYFGYLAVKVGPVKVGSALDGGAVNTVSTSTDFTAVKGTVYTLVGSSTACTSRKITAGAGGIAYTLDDYRGDTLTNGVGHWLAASSTVDLDGAVSGCGRIRIRADATGVIRITDYR